MPSAWRMTSSSSETPAPKRSVREQRPPIVRAATSTIQGPCSFTRSSAWIGPSASPSARAAQRASAAIAAWTSAGSREGVT